jgi:hypothetical protein
MLMIHLRLLVRSTDTDPRARRPWIVLLQSEGPREPRAADLRHLRPLALLFSHARASIAMVHILLRSP